MDSKASYSSHRTVLPFDSLRTVPTKTLMAPEPKAVAALVASSIWIGLSVILIIPSWQVKFWEVSSQLSEFIEPNDLAH